MCLLQVCLTAHKPVVDDSTYTTFDVLIRPEYAVFVDGTDELSRRYSQIIAVALDQIKQNNDEKFDRQILLKMLFWIIFFG